METMSKMSVLEDLNTVAERYRLIAIYAFGSQSKAAFARVQGEDTPANLADSDLDIGILPYKDKKLSVDEKVQLGLTFERIFKASRVDLVVLPESPPFLALEIVRGELLYTSDPVQEAEYELFVLRRAGDLAPWERERRKMLLEGEAI